MRRCACVGIVLLSSLLLSSLLLSSLTLEAQTPRKGVLLENLTWTAAEARLTPETVVVIPLGAAAKEHGPHLQLNNDWLMAEYLKNRVLAVADVVIAPTINYSFYPAFVEYPGSTTVSLETARDTVLGICRTLAAHGPKKFYVLNTGVSTVRPLKAAAETAKAEGITITFFEYSSIEEAERKVLSADEGTHAGESETSMMLYMAPDTVDMTKAVRDFNPPFGKGPLHRKDRQDGVYSPTGVFGDATKATREKGRVIVEAMVSAILKGIEDLRAAK